MKKALLLIPFYIICTLASAQLTVSGFTNYSLHGFNVLVNNSALSQHSAETQQAIGLLDTMLMNINNLNLASDIMDTLHHVSIFMEYNLTTGSAWYHYDVNWLIANGYNPAKARCVEIANLTHFYAWSKQNQPWVMMHELAHAFNDHTLTTSYAPIINAYNAAISSGIYNSVPYNPGNGGALFNLPAYAKNNYLEYFAEISEAYLGHNDYYPFDSTDLKTFDPAGYAVVKSVWRFGNATAIDPARSESLAVLASPNPAQDFVRIHIPESGPFEAQVINPQGQVIATIQDVISEKGYEWSCAGLPAGIYLIRCKVGNLVGTTKVIKQ